MGYHLYCFYQKDEKLVKNLADFFAEGLRKSEYCMWVPREDITQNKAMELLKRHIPDIEDYLLARQMCIEPFEEWYLTEDRNFSIDAMMEKWKSRYEEVMQKGYAMMRVAGDVSYIAKEHWDDLMAYESLANEIINDTNCATICTYKGKIYKPTEISMILKNHLCPFNINS
jgi:hypothetical protein